MIPEDYKEEIVQNGIQFMRSITEAYGSDEGLRLWDTIASTLDPDVKGQIFFAMLSGHYQGRILITAIRRDASMSHTGINRVNMIKALRNATGWGLKESKDAIDALIDNHQKIWVECPQGQYQQHRFALRAAGLEC
jgi:hypothetical protein